MEFGPFKAHVLTSNCGIASYKSATGALETHGAVHSCGNKPTS